MSVSSRDIHDQEFKVRLTEKQAKMIEAIADFRDIPRAVLLREFIHLALSQPAAAPKHNGEHISA